MKKIITLSMVLLLGCSPTSNTQEIEEEKPSEVVLDYSFVTTSIKWNDVFEQEESRYLVYFYSEYCGYCKSIKEDFISYYLLNKEKIYFVDAIKEKAVYRGGAANTVGIDNIEDFYIPGTPFLAEISNWMVTNYYAGMEAVKMYIFQANNV